MTGRTAAAVALLAAAALLAGPARAWAHGESSPTIQTVVDGTEPALPGVDFEVLPGPAARLSAVNRTRETLTVAGGRGEPMLRIGPRGVEANVNSLDWYRSGNPDGVADPPPDARIGERPRFVRVLRRSSFAWFDHRMHPGTVEVPRAALDAGRDARLDDWRVPARLGGRRIEVRGHVEYRPLLGTVETEVRSRATPLPGVQVTPLQGPVPGFLLVSTGSRRVTVTGEGGEPFARVGPGGVEVNLASRTHRDDQAARGLRVPAPARGVRWRRVSGSPRYAWLDSRAAYRGRPPERVTAAGKKATLGEWAIPLAAGGREAELRGATVWTPYANAARREAAAPRGWALSVLGSALLVLVLGLAGAVVLRRRGAARRVSGRA